MPNKPEEERSGEGDLNGDHPLALHAAICSGEELPDEFTVSFPTNRRGKGVWESQEWRGALDGLLRRGYSIREWESAKTATYNVTCERITPNAKDTHEGQCKT